MVGTKNLNFKVTLTLGLPERMFQMAHLHQMENNCVIILLKSIHKIVEVTVQTNSDGRTHAHTPTCHSDNYVSVNASGLDKDMAEMFGFVYERVVWVPGSVSINHSVERPF